jgi:hypothetical protein
VKFPGLSGGRPKRQPDEIVSESGSTVPQNKTRQPRRKKPFVKAEQRGTNTAGPGMGGMRAAFGRF